MVTVGQATEKDVAGIRRVLVETWLATYAVSYSAEAIRRITDTWHASERLVKQIQSPEVFFGVARLDDGDIVGIVTATHHPDRKTLSIGRLYVLPKFQRRGIGSILLKAALNAFDGIRQSELSVEASNAAGRAFWVGQGYRVAGERAVQVGEETMPLVDMQKGMAR